MLRFIKPKYDIKIVYMYDEVAYGSIPSQADAERILTDLRAGRAFPHPISSPGYEQRLEDIIAERPVDPAYYAWDLAVDNRTQNATRIDRSPGRSVQQDKPKLLRRCFTKYF